MRTRLEIIPEELRNVFQWKGDYYRAMAGHIFGKPSNDVTKEERYRVKQCMWWFFTMRGPEILTDLIQGEDDSV